MTQPPDSAGSGGRAAQARAARLAAALKSNMARRKAQGRARAIDAAETPADGQDRTRDQTPGEQQQTE